MPTRASNQREKEWLMDKVAIVTDSTACIPKQLVDQYGIEIVPLHLIFEERDYLNGVDITTEEFYPMLRQAKRLPTTSAASAGEYLEFFRKVAETANSIVCVTVSSKLSATFKSAEQARELAKETLPNVSIHIIDSRTSAMAQGFIVLAAARAAAEGRNLEEVVKVAEDLVPRVNLVVMVDTLDYLVKGGRVPKAAGWVGSLLSIKPILEVKDGEVELIERARTRDKAMRRLLEIMRGRIGSDHILHVAVHHADIPGEAERLKGQIASQFNCAELYVTGFTPIMGAHTGPGLLGLSFYTEKQLEHYR
jgi:DegV family protein with EDD domain